MDAMGLGPYGFTVGHNNLQLQDRFSTFMSGIKGKTATAAADCALERRGTTDGGMRS